MSTLVVYADAADGLIQSSDWGAAPSYSAVRDGTGIYLVADTTGTSYNLGQSYWFADPDDQIDAYQWFGGFDTSSIGTGDTVSAAVFSLTADGDYSTQDFDVQLRSYDSGATVTTADWRNSTALPACTLRAHYSTASGWTTGTAYDFTDDALPAGIVKAGTTRLLLCSSRLASGTAPAYGVNELVFFRSADYTGTTSDPKLTVTYAAGGGPLSFLMLEDDSGAYELEDGSGGIALE